MRRYSTDGQDTNTAATTIVALEGNTTIKAKIYDVISGSDATPADNAAEYNLQRFSAAGTATAVTPRPLDPSDPASLAEAGEAHSAEPTYTADLILLNFAHNQRATFRWVAAPEGELVAPATDENGIGDTSITVAGSAVNTVVTFHHAE